MFRLAAAALFLTLLPRLPKQVILMNMRTDLPELNSA